MKQAKFLIALIGAILILIGVALKDDLSGLFETGQTQIPAEQRLEIDYLDVGQGDAILIKTPYNQKILIDGGPDNSVLNELGANLPFFDNQIDIMILTHPHSDHVVGLVEILKRYQVNEVYYTGAVHTTDDYLAWLKEIKEQAIPLKIVKEPFDLTLGDNLKLEFLYPTKDFTNQHVSELNDTSIVTRLVYKNKKFLFTGDAGVEVESELLASNGDLTADVLKIGHHGSSSASSEDFLTAVKPTTAIISCGLDNDFGHPHLSVIRRLERLGIDILRTDQSGTIKLFSDGEKIEFGD
jgi:competence protein ComEC